MAELVRQAMSELRIHPIGKRVRAEVDGTTVVDSTSVMVVWEPRRVVPSYAVPVGRNWCVDRATPTTRHARRSDTPNAAVR